MEIRLAMCMECSTEWRAFCRTAIWIWGRSFSGEELELLKLTPAAYLGSCRFKLPEDLEDDFYKTSL